MDKVPLKIKELTKSYGKARGVDGVSLKLKQGEIFGFLGPNGAGKSTTIRTILNFINPSSGTISIFGLDSVRDSVAAKKKMGYLAGDIALPSKMTGNQLLRYLSSYRQNTDWQLVEELTEKLQAQLDRRISSLSKGNRQKIGLIQAFMHRPDLLVLDEPTSGLDPLMKQIFYDMAHQAKKDGKTVFVSSHDLSEVQKICDRAAFIREGKLVATEKIQNSSNLNLRRYRIKFSKKPDKQSFEGIKGVSDVQVDGKNLTLTVRGTIAPLIKELAKHEPTDMDERETTLEDVFMHYYQEEDDV